MTDQDINREGIADAHEAARLEVPRTFVGTYEESLDRLTELGLGDTSARGILRLADMGDVVGIGNGQAVRRSVLAGKFAILNGA